MKTYSYKGHDIQIFEGYDGDQVFIYKGEVKIYSARVHKGDAENMVKFKLG